MKSGRVHKLIGLEIKTNIYIIKNIKSSTQNSNELIHGHYFYLSDIVANGYFFSDCLIYSNMIHSEMKDFSQRFILNKV